MHDTMNVSNPLYFSSVFRVLLSFSLRRERLARVRIMYGKGARSRFRAFFSSEIRGERISLQNMLTEYVSRVSIIPLPTCLLNLSLSE